MKADSRQSTESQQVKQANTSSGRHFPKPVVILLVLGVIAGLAYFLFHLPKAPGNKLQVSGRVEGYETNIGPKIGGRVDFISSREGELVKRGQLLVQISDDDIQAQLRGAKAHIQKAQEQSQEATFKLQVIDAQIAEAKLRVSQSREDSAGRIRESEANVARTQARLSQAQSDLLQAQADEQLAKVRKDRYEFLVARLAVTKDEYDQAATTYENNKALVQSRQANVRASERELKVAIGQLTQARSSRLSPRMMQAELLGYEKQHIEAQHELFAAQDEIRNAQADSDQVSANVAYLKILCPIDGVVTARAVEPGAVVVPGQTLLSLINLDTVYMRAYVPEGEIGKVRIGQPAKVMLDARPDKAMDGRIIQIDPQGSFTPENIYFKNDRVRQVFGIKIEIDQPGGFAKPGMPADAEIVLN